jgi:hypothetical protein
VFCDEGISGTKGSRPGLNQGVIDHPNGATHDRLIGPPYDRPNGASFKWPF